MIKTIWGSARNSNIFSREPILCSEVDCGRVILVAAQNTFNQNESLGADFFPHLNFHLLFHIFLPVAAFIQLKVYIRRVYIRGKCKLCSFIILFAFSLVWDMMYTLQHASLPPSWRNLASRQNTTLGTSKVDLLFDKNKVMFYLY